jgi:UDP-N-acetylglucosamine 3-dehydrogenase
VSRENGFTIAVVGLGFGAIHARVLSEMDGVSLAAVCDTNPQRMTLASRGRTLKAYTDYRELLREERLDALVVAVPTRLHEEVALAAIERGVSVLIEKPIAPTLGEGRRLTQAAQKAGVALMAGHIERFNPAVVELRRRVQAGEAGRVLQVAARRVGPFAPRDRDVSVIHDLALHDIDAMRYVLGAEVERAFAEGYANVATAYVDSVVGLLRFSRGAGIPAPIGLLEVNWLTPKKVRELYVLGDRGLFVVDYSAQTLEFHENGASEGAGVGWATLVNLRGADAGSVVRILVPAREALEQELRAFVEALKAGAPMPVGADDALAALAVADALAESIETGLPVRPRQP